MFEHHLKISSIFLEMTTSPQTSALAVELDWKLKPTLLHSGFKMFEPYNEVVQRRVENLLDSEDASEFHELLKTYRDNVKPTFQCVEATYPRRINNLGRSFLSSVDGKRQIAWTSMPRNLRNTIIRGLVYDIDLVKAQPSILQQICRNAGLECPQLDNMVNNRDQFLQIVCNHYPVSRADAKELINTLMFGGSLDSWKYSQKIDIEDDPAMVQGCKDFSDEMVYITGELKIQNLPLVKVIKTLKGEKKESKNERGSFLAHYLQHQEFIIVDHAMKWLDDRAFFDYKAPNRKLVKVGSYEYDGFKLWRQVIDSKGGDIDSILHDLNTYIHTTFGPGISFAVKELDSLLPFEGIDEDNKKRKREDDGSLDEQTSEDTDRSNPYLTEEYMAWKKNFEDNLGWCKILQDSSFVRKYYEHGIYQGLVEKSKKDIIIAYEHQQYIVDTKTWNGPYPFIETWIKHDSTIKVFERIDCIPHDQVCSPEVFNLWTPYAMENITEWSFDEDYLQFWLRHFLILCGNNHEVAFYFQCFLGQMIRFPSTKPGVAIDFISKEGAGKNTIFELCKRMFGNSKVFNCSDPARDIWGPFNSPMKDAIFVLINELNKKDTVAAEGKIKDLITEPTFTLNEKGRKQLTLPSYHRFLSFQNNDHGDAGKRTKNGDRRNLIIRCSDELIGNKEYWNDVYNNKLTDINGIKTVYEYLKSLPRVTDFHTLPLPITEYQENLKEANRCPLELFIMDYVTVHHKETTKQISTAALFDAFNKWKDTNHVVYQVTKNAFGVRLKNLAIPGMNKGPHTEKGSTWVLDCEVLKAHYKIGCILDVSSEDDDDLDTEP